MVEDNLGVNFIATAIYGNGSDFFLSILRKFLENNFSFVIYMFLYASGIPAWKLLLTTAPVLTGFHQNWRENEEIKQTKLFFIKQSYKKDCEQREAGKHEKHRGQKKLSPLTVSFSEKLSSGRRIEQLTKETELPHNTNKSDVIYTRRLIKKGWKKCQMTTKLYGG